MSVRKRIERENAEVSAESQEDVPSARDEVPPSVATREMRCREREHRAKNKDLTEDEMMALAMRLSEQEADITAQRLHEEEEAVRKAIQNSMFSESQSLMDAPTHLCVSSRRKLVYSNGDSQIEDQGQRAAGHMTRKRRRMEGSPLKEMPDLSQTQMSLSSSEATAPGSQSPQSCESTQIEDCDLPPSPVFPSSLARVQVHIPRLDQNLLNSCNSSGFVLCSQGSAISVCQQTHQSPTFPKSPGNPTSTVEETNSQRLDFADNTQPELSQEPRTSPVFGFKERSTSALKGETMEGFALLFSSQESSTSFSSDKDASLRKSPVFSKTQTGELDRCERTDRHSPVFGTDMKTVTNDEEEQTLSQTEPTIDMTLHWSEEEDDDDSTPVASPSPVFPEEKSSPQTVKDNEKNDPSQTQSRSAASQSGAVLNEALCVSGDSVPLSTVHYYWGVPFCPKGLDPDQYTKVIMAQLEVCEKSLKTAQRGLLNKANWGEPILPQPEKSPSAEPSSSPNIHAARRSRRLRGKVKELDSEEEVEDTQTSQKHLWEEEEAQEEGDNQGGIEKKEEDEPTEKAQEEDLRENRLQGDSDCEVCPETQLSDDSTQELPLLSQPPESSPETGTIRVDSPNVPEMQRPQTPEPEQPMNRDPEPAEAGRLDLDLGDPQCQLQSRESPLQSQSADPDQNLNKNLDSQDLTGSDDDSALAPGPDLVSDCPIQCPLCQRAFPSDQIEMHAAYCDGGPKTVSAKLRRKRTRREEAEDANHTDLQPSAAPAQEKCYICLKAVPLRDYSLHTDKCFQRPGIRTATTGRLLSALDQSEPRISEAGPSGSTALPQEVIDLVDDDDDESAPLIQISNSPIRAFTSISNAQDCLIDFNRQHRDKRPGPRGGTKHRSKRR